MPKFDPVLVLQTMESLRLDNGAFRAAPAPDYAAMWWRDMLYCTRVYQYTGEYDKFKQGIWLILDFFKKYKRNLVRRIVSPTSLPDAVIYAKVDPASVEQTPEYENWGHYQLDVFGLLLYTIADAIYKNIPGILRDSSDEDIVQHLVYYLRSVEYWQSPDMGMWEECSILHSSSIGAVVAGLSYLKSRDVNIVVEDTLIGKGKDALWGVKDGDTVKVSAILPRESNDYCGRRHHSHDCDAAQLFLIWPFHLIEKREDQDLLISRIVDGHNAENGDAHRLLQPQGFNRYWGDDYYRSTEGQYRGISAMWPMFFFLLSIIYSQRHDTKKARYWFERGCESTVDGKVTEACQNGKPNDHTPLGWGNALAMIAFTKLPADVQTELSADIKAEVSGESAVPKEKAA